MSRHALLAILLALAIGGCTAEDFTPDAGGDAPSDTGPIHPPAHYVFPGADGSESSVSYSGQTFRHVLITELKTFVGGLTDSIDAATFAPAEDGDVIAALDFYFRFDSETDGATGLFAFDTDPPTLQQVFDDISSDKDLVGKVAGNDTVTDHVDWSVAFAGWQDDSLAQFGGSISTPEGFVIAIFETLEENAIAHAEGNFRAGPGTPVLPVHVTESGVDLNQLLNKFLLMAVTFSQGTDDYLDDDVDGKGLLASNAPEEGATYSDLMHAWDEGFGYFGAARDYADYTDDEIAARPGADTRAEYESGYHDTDGDGTVDLRSEFNFGASVNAAKRDRDSSDEVPTDFTSAAFDAFVQGRTIIQNAGHQLSAEDLDDLRGARDIAVANWESAIAATVVHYINDTLADMDAFGATDYSFLDHAMHWSEMKGFALGLQFNPSSPLSDADFATLHGLLGDAPVLEAAGVETISAYRDDLLAARSLLADAYEFDDTNVGRW